MTARYEASKENRLSAQLIREALKNNELPSRSSHVSLFAKGVLLEGKILFHETVHAFKGASFKSIALKISILPIVLTTQVVLSLIRVMGLGLGILLPSVAAMTLIRTENIRGQIHDIQDKIVVPPEVSLKLVDPATACFYLKKSAVSDPDYANCLTNWINFHTTRLNFQMQDFGIGAIGATEQISDKLTITKESDEIYGVLLKEKRQNLYEFFKFVRNETLEHLRKSNLYDHKSYDQFSHRLDCVYLGLGLPSFLLPQDIVDDILNDIVTEKLSCEEKAKRISTLNELFQSLDEDQFFLASQILYAYALLVNNPLLSAKAIFLSLKSSEERNSDFKSLRSLEEVNNLSVGFEESEGLFPTLQANIYNIQRGKTYLIALKDEVGVKNVKWFETHLQTLYRACHKINNVDSHWELLELNLHCQIPLNIWQQPDKGHMAAVQVLSSLLYNVPQEGASIRKNKMQATISLETAFHRRKLMEIRSETREYQLREIYIDCLDCIRTSENLDQSTLLALEINKLTAMKDIFLTSPHNPFKLEDINKEYHHLLSVLELLNYKSEEHVFYLFNALDWFVKTKNEIKSQAIKDILHSLKDKYPSIAEGLKAYQSAA
jgi:hypothetical protein